MVRHNLKFRCYDNFTTTSPAPYLPRIDKIAPSKSLLACYCTVAGFPCEVPLAGAVAQLTLFVAGFPSGFQRPITGRRSKSRHRGCIPWQQQLWRRSCDDAVFYVTLQNEFRCRCSFWFRILIILPCLLNDESMKYAAASGSKTTRQIHTELAESELENKGSLTGPSWSHTTHHPIRLSSF